MGAVGRVFIFLEGHEDFNFGSATASGLDIQPSAERFDAFTNTEEAESAAPGLVLVEV